MIPLPPRIRWSSAHPRAVLLQRQHAADAWATAARLTATPLTSSSNGTEVWFVSNGARRYERTGAEETYELPLFGISSQGCVSIPGEAAGVEQAFIAGVQPPAKIFES